VQDAPGAAQNHSACMCIVVGCYRVSFCAVVCVNAELNTNSDAAVKRYSCSTHLHRLETKSARDKMHDGRKGCYRLFFVCCCCYTWQSCAYATEPCQDVFNLKLATITRKDCRNEHWARATLAVHSLYTQ